MRLSQDKFKKDLASRRGFSNLGTSFPTAAIYLVSLFVLPSIICSCDCATFLNAPSEPREVQFVAKHRSEAPLLRRHCFYRHEYRQWEEMHRRVNGAGGPQSGDANNVFASEEA